MILRKNILKFKKIFLLLSCKDCTQLQNKLKIKNLTGSVVK